MNEEIARLILKARDEAARTYQELRAERDARLAIYRRKIAAAPEPEATEVQEAVPQTALPTDAPHADTPTGGDDAAAALCPGPRPQGPCQTPRRLPDRFHRLFRLHHPAQLRGPDPPKRMAPRRDSNEPPRRGPCDTIPSATRTGGMAFDGPPNVGRRVGKRRHGGLTGYWRKLWS